MERNDSGEMPGSPAVDTKWHDVYNKSETLQTDADGRGVGNLSIHTSPSGNMSMPILGLGASAYNGFIPLIPIMFGNASYTPTPDNRYFLGSFPDVRAVNAGGLSAGVEHIVGSDTWLIFPVTRAIGSSGSGEEWSADMGIAYKKVVI